MQSIKARTVFVCPTVKAIKQEETCSVSPIQTRMAGVGETNKQTNRLRGEFNERNKTG